MIAVAAIAVVASLASNDTIFSGGSGSNIVETGDVETRVTVSLVSAPTTATQGEPIEVSWAVEGIGTAVHSAVHYDYVSHAGTMSTDISPAASGYSHLTPDHASGSFNLPQTFSASITPEMSGTLFYRAHAIVNGLNYWTDEMSISVSSSSSAGTESSTKEVALEADDNGYYLENGTKIETILFNQGDTANFVFTTRTTNVAFGGLDYRSAVFDTVKAAPGETVSTGDFVISSPFEISSYWPGTNQLKAILKIEIA